VSAFLSESYVLGAVEDLLEDDDAAYDSIDVQPELAEEEALARA
jgi:hypothetical protein